MCLISILSWISPAAVSPRYLIEPPLCLATVIQGPPGSTPRVKMNRSGSRKNSFRTPESTLFAAATARPMNQNDTFRYRRLKGFFPGSTSR